ncbi:MAG: DUF4352 domain-containing protein [Candidatus Diapherotrites archaeon]|nr:DUF4352 domain-containing protein [Candidatus Diapherotrites archaeon]
MTRVLLILMLIFLISGCITDIATEKTQKGFVEFREEVHVDNFILVFNSFGFAQEFNNNIATSGYKLVVVSVDVKNNGTEEEHFPSFSELKLKTDRGSLYDYEVIEPLIRYTKFKPKEEKKVMISFEIPEDEAPTEITICFREGFVKKTIRIKMPPSPELDLQPPKISNVRVVNITQDSVTIEWLSDEPADSKVVFWRAFYPNREVYDPSMTTTHTITIEELDPGTYKFKIVSTDENGNTAVNDNNTNYYVFEISPPPVISPPPIIANAGEQITIGNITIIFEEPRITKQISLFEPDEGYKFVIINIVAKNNGVRETNFPLHYRYAKLIVDRGYQYTHNSWLSDRIYSIKPGDEEEGSLVFEILDETTPLELQFHNGLLDKQQIIIKFNT